MYLRSDSELSSSSSSSIPTTSSATFTPSSCLPSPSLPCIGPGPALSASPTPQAALAADIQQFGKQNFVGLLILSVFIVVGLALWLTFGHWPRRTFRKLRGSTTREQLKRGAAGHAGSESTEQREARGRDSTVESARDLRRGAEAKVRASIETSNLPQPVVIEVEGLTKGLEEAKERTGPRVRFA